MPTVRGHSSLIGADDRKCPDGLRDVLEALLAHWTKCEQQLVADLVVNAAGYADAAGFCRRLEARSNINTIAQQICSLHHYVADIGADTELDTPSLRKLVVQGSQCRLDFGGAAHGFDGAWEFGQDGIAGRIENSTMMVRNNVFEHLTMATEGCER